MAVQMLEELKATLFGCMENKQENANPCTGSRPEGHEGS